MSDPIKVGDLVVVVRCHCAEHAAALGTIWRVESIQPNPNFKCNCGQRWDSGPTAVKFHDGTMLRGEPICYLKRIPPLEELEGEKLDEELHA